MTSQQIDEKKRAEDLATAVGGALAVILGLRATDTPVKWDSKKARFTVGGRLISMETIRRELRRFETAVGVRMAKLADRLSSGSITLPEWQTEMKQLVGSSHVVMAAVAAGSIAAAVNSKTVHARMMSEQKYVDGFAGDVKKKKLEKPTISARSKSYLLAAAVTFAVVGLAVHKSTGYTEAKRTRTAAESCPDCIAYAGEWMPIDDCPEIGSLTCGSRCRCYVEYR